MYRKCAYNDPNLGESQTSYIIDWAGGSFIDGTDLKKRSLNKRGVPQESGNNEWRSQKIVTDFPEEDARSIIPQVEMGCYGQTPWQGRLGWETFTANGFQTWFPGLIGHKGSNPAVRSSQ